MKNIRPTIYTHKTWLYQVINDELTKEWLRSMLHHKWINTTNKRGRYMKYTIHINVIWGTCFEINAKLWHFNKEHLLKIMKNKKCSNVAVYIWTNEPSRKLVVNVMKNTSEELPGSSVLPLIHHKYRDKPVCACRVTT